MIPYWRAILMYVSLYYGQKIFALVPFSGELFWWRSQSQELAIEIKWIQELSIYVIE